jgi:hypothetical protein
MNRIHDLAPQSPDSIGCAHFPIGVRSPTTIKDLDGFGFHASLMRERLAERNFILLEIAVAVDGDYGL